MASVRCGFGSCRNKTRHLSFRCHHHRPLKWEAGYTSHNEVPQADEPHILKVLRTELDSTCERIEKLKDLKFALEALIEEYENA